VTLRGRLTAAFLAVVLGPVLLGALFVGGTVAAVGRDRAVERLGLAATSVQTSIGSLCQQLYAAADAVAVADAERKAAVAGQVVARGLASGVVIEDPAGNPTVQTPAPPPRPWADCGQPVAGGGPFQALTARVDVRDAAGLPLGTVWAAHLVDAGMIDRLAAAGGTAVTLLGGGDRPGAVLSTEPASSLDEVVAVAARADRVRGAGVAEAAGGRYVRVIDPSAGQPLPLLVSVPTGQPQGLYAALVAAVLLAGLFAVLAAWWLARSTTRPLAELGSAADRVADGDLEARVPVRGRDEVGRLAATFNRMTRETQAYVHALTASRDQLRGHLAVLGDTLSSTHDLQRILQVILQTALAATGAKAGAVLLLDPATGTLVGQVTEGLAELWPPSVGPAGKAAKPGPVPEPDSLKVPLGSGLVGGVAATGVPQRGRIDRDGPVLSAHEPRCRTYVAVPFAVPGPVGDAGGPGEFAALAPRAPVVAAGLWPTALPTALGVLALYDRLGSDEFDDADLITLRTFAGQAAVAVDNVRVHREAQRLSLTDPLTGLWNYRYLKESIRREVERANRFGRMLAVLALDLDRFKDVNDGYGHAAGDAVLIEFARRVRHEIREVDLAFRQGGEEFVVLLPETDASGGATVAERLGAAIREQPILVEPSGGGPPSRLDITVSIGIAVYPDHADNGQAVLDAADDALYAAKASGRDRYRIAGDGAQSVPPQLLEAAGHGPSPPHQPAGPPPGVEGPRPTWDRTVTREFPVLAAAAPPDDGLPRAGGASSGTRPPRQSRGG
jgi:two-component system cell cycle response regulator